MPTELFDKYRREHSFTPEASTNGKSRIAPRILLISCKSIRASKASDPQCSRKIEAEILFQRIAALYQTEFKNLKLYLRDV